MEENWTKNSQTLGVASNVDRSLFYAAQFGAVRIVGAADAALMPQPVVGQDLADSC